MNGLSVAAGGDPLFDDAALAAMDRGLSFLFMGKQSLYSRLGAATSWSRTPSSCYAKYRRYSHGGSAQNAYGAAQRRGWPRHACRARRHLEGAGQFGVVRPADPRLHQSGDRLHASAQLPRRPAHPAAGGRRPVGRLPGFACADWSRSLQGLGNVAIVSGDIHASFVTDHGHGASSSSPVRPFPRRRGRRSCGRRIW